ncbi:endonuclease/exonuclease/phosphatase family protein [Ornithinimicrobium sp. Arc0846-15]|nr:endonuclease/exonuclease/phosphatase family protein [Ornithinimicrobium laminariae]
MIEAPRAARQAGQWRVASYNLRALQDDVSATVRVMRAIDPDVVLLQEIPRVPFSARAMHDFAQQCGLTWPGRTRRVSGVSMLVHSRLQASAAQDRALPVEFLGNPRTYTVARLADEFGHHAAAVAIHLPLIAAQRRDHVAQILAELTRDPLTRDLPWIIGGDINEDQTAPAWQMLAAHAELVTPLKPSFPAHNPHRTIDAIFATQDVSVSGEAEIDLDPADVTAATDHVPVWVDVQVPSRQP